MQQKVTQEERADVNQPCVLDIHDYKQFNQIIFYTVKISQG